MRDSITLPSLIAPLTFAPGLLSTVQCAKPGKKEEELDWEFVVTIIHRALLLE